VKHNLAEKTFFMRFSHPWGVFVIEGGPHGVRSIHLPAPNTVHDVCAALTSLERPLPGWPTRLYHTMYRYFSGEKTDFRGIPVDLSSGTEFQKQVWRTAQAILYGHTVSYRALAVRAGFSPSHARAVAQALARNPIPLLIPCHRVIGADGNLKGYSGGEAWKPALLRLEGLNV
jgi:methylated-DNA-[protein]-cysteine S-methyltransferase